MERKFTANSWVNSLSALDSPFPCLSVVSKSGWQSASKEKCAYCGRWKSSQNDFKDVQQNDRTASSGLGAVFYRVHPLTLWPKHPQTANCARPTAQDSACNEDSSCHLHREERGMDWSQENLMLFFFLESPVQSSNPPLQSSGNASPPFGSSTLNSKLSGI